MDGDWRGRNDSDIGEVIGGEAGRETIGNQVRWIDKVVAEWLSSSLVDVSESENRRKVGDRTPKPVTRTVSSSVLVETSVSLEPITTLWVGCDGRAN